MCSLINLFSVRSEILKSQCLGTYTIQKSLYGALFRIFARPAPCPSPPRRLNVSRQKRPTLEPKETCSGRRRGGSRPFRKPAQASVLADRDPPPPRLVHVARVRTERWFLCVFATDGCVRNRFACSQQIRNTFAKH
jgi:hypothetical protein